MTKYPVIFLKRTKLVEIKLTDVVHGASAELGKELLDPEELEVLDDVGPQVEDVVSGEGGPLLTDYNGGPKQGSLNGCPQAAWSTADYHNLQYPSNKQLKWWSTMEMFV